MTTSQTFVNRACVALNDAEADLMRLYMTTVGTGVDPLHQAELRLKLQRVRSARAALTAVGEPT